MRVLITGGYGCIGSWIVHNLLARGNEAWIYDLKEDPRRMRLIMSEAQVRQVHFVQGDVTDLDNLQTAIAANRISHVVHLAGLQVPTCRANPILGAKVNVLGTLAVFEAVRASAGQVNRLVYASSGAVFGPPEYYRDGPKGTVPFLEYQKGDSPFADKGIADKGTVPFLEYQKGDSPLADDVSLALTTHYGYFKCCNEGNARVYFQDHGLSSIGLRPWTVFGVGRDFGMTSEPTKAIKCLALGRPYHISYGGWQDLQYVDDVAKIFVRCLEAPYTGAKSYNLRGHVVDLATFHKALGQIEPAAANLITFGDKQIPIAYDLDDSALQRDLGPMPRTSLEDGIQKTLEQFKELQAEGRLDTADIDA